MTFWHKKKSPDLAVRTQNKIAPLLNIYETNSTPRGRWLQMQ